MHAILRQVHLFCAFLLSAFVVMYFITGYVLTHHGWFGDGPSATTERTVALTPGAVAPVDEAAWASTVMEQCGVRGQRGKVRQRPDGTLEIPCFRPGHLLTLRVAADGRTAVVKEERLAWQRTLIGFHRLHGYGHGWGYDLWAFLFDLVSVSMIVFAVTGVCLWHRLARRRGPGWWVLAAGFLFVLASVLQFVMAP
jgi:hypothetical protein